MVEWLTPGTLEDSNTQPVLALGLIVWIVPIPTPKAPEAYQIGVLVGGELFTTHTSLQPLSFDSRVIARP